MHEGARPRRGRLGTLDTKSPLILSDYLATYLLNNNKQGTSVFRKSFRSATCVLMRLEFIDYPSGYQAIYCNVGFRVRFKILYRVIQPLIQHCLLHKMTYLNIIYVIAT